MFETLLLLPALYVAAAEAPLETSPQPGGYQAGLTKLLRVNSAVRVWGPGINTPGPGGSLRYDPAPQPEPTRDGNSFFGSENSSAGMPSNQQDEAQAAASDSRQRDARDIAPGGYQAGLTKLLRVNSHVRVWGPGIKTPEPGGRILAEPHK